MPTLEIIGKKVISSAFSVVTIDLEENEIPHLKGNKVPQLYLYTVK
jgi:hypothetical protein